MLMRFHYGLGVGHMYSHGQQSVSNQGSHPQNGDENIPDTLDAEEEQNVPSTSGEHVPIQSSSEDSSGHYSGDDSWNEGDEEFYGLDEMYGSAS